MSVAWLDTEAAERAAAAWTVHADRLHRSAFELEHQLAGLALDAHSAPVQQLTAAATELWLLAAVTHRTVAAARLGDSTFDTRSYTAQLTAAVGHVGLAPPFSSVFGELGGTGERELRPPYAPGGATPTERGRDLVARALADTSATRRIRADEVGLVRIDRDRYVVVLPGVVDLTSPDLGWSEQHRSVRDLDRAAWPSSQSTGTAGNPYARAVADALGSAGVPSGSDLLVVGHSFGADTALDLAADSAFNGPDGYRVTHVVAAGYHSSPQLPSVPGTTEVLVLQNHRDVPVIVEAIGDAHVTDALTSSAAAVAAVATLDPIGAVVAQSRSVGHQVGALWSAASHLVDRADDLADVVVGAATVDPGRVRSGVGSLVTLEPGVRTPAAGQVVSVFEGGGQGAGHSPEHYAAHVRTAAHPAVTGFLASLDAAGYARGGVAMGVDVSVPAD